MNTLKKIFETENDLWLTFFRIVAAFVMFPHGAQKLFGWFDGYGFENTLNFYSANLGIPAFLGLLNILVESVGAVILALGLFTRVTSFGLLVTMFVAVFFGGHFQYGFFMNWSGSAAGEGFEYHILYSAITLILMIKGGGAYALDSVLISKLQGASEQ